MRWFLSEKKTNTAVSNVYRVVIVAVQGIFLVSFLSFLFFFQT